MHAEMWPEPLGEILKGWQKLSDLPRNGCAQRKVQPRRNVSDSTNSGAEGLVFRVLGPLEVLRDGCAIRIGGPRQRAVLARLLLDVDKVVSRDALAAAIWEDSVPPGYVTTLQTYVFHLRQALEPARPHDKGPTVLVTQSGGYRLAVPAESLDAVRFETLAAKARQLLAHGENVAAVVQFDEALALWRGPVLPDLADYGFVAPLAARLEEERLVAVETQIDAELSLGEHAAMVARLTDVVDQHPLRERLHARLMLALYRCGRQSEALDAYGRLRARLVSELGIEPGPEVQELHQQILAHDPDLAGPPRAPARPAESPAPSAPHKRRRGWFVAAAAAAAIIAGTASTAAVLMHHPRANLDAIPGNSIGALRPDGTIRAALPAGHSPAAIQVHGGSAWVAESAQSEVWQIDLHTGSVVQNLPVAGKGAMTPTALTVFGADVWVVGSSSGNVLQIDRRTGEVNRSIPVGHSPSAVSGGFGAVWVTNESDATVTRIDPSGAGSSETIDVGDAPDAIAVGAGAVWVANRADSTVSRIDPRTLKMTKLIRVGAGPAGMVFTTEALWVADSLDLTVSRIDLRSFEVTKTRVDDTPTDVAVLGNAVWVSAAGSDVIDRVDGRTARVTGRFRIGGPPRALSSSGGSLWVLTQPTPTGHRGGTLRIAVEGFVYPDPVMWYTTPMINTVYDSLVTEHRADGAGGYELVPDLAVSLPEPADGGLRYTFAVRRGIRYSDGRTLRASDFRRGLEREIPLAAKNTYPSYFAVLVGAHACLRRLTRHCDLSGGVLTDDRASTVVFRLTRPDPDFVAELAAFDLAAPVPPGTPASPDRDHPVPGTGPYMSGAVVAGRSVTLVRNPYFQVWSAAAQPDGYPDAIEWISVKSSVDEVQAGKADVALLSPDEAARLAPNYPDRLKTDPTFGTHFLVLNSKVPPFNNRLARIAVAYAFTDDAVIARLEGGTPACTLVPPNWPGQQNDCPYPANRAKADALVRRSGTAGLRVRVYFYNCCRFVQIGRYVTSVLNRIGYRAQLVLESEPALSRYDAHSRPADVEGDQWLPDFPAISQYYQPVLSCADGQVAVFVCNPALDGVAAAASRTQADDPGAGQRAWQALYADVVRDARVVVNSTVQWNDVFEAPRVGNTHWSPFIGLLFDQLTVR